MRRRGRGRCKPLSGWMIAAHIWRRSMEWTLRATALMAAGLVMSIDSTDPSVGWLDFGAVFGGVVLTAYVSWRLAEGMARAPFRSNGKRRAEYDNFGKDLSVAGGRCRAH